MKIQDCLQIGKMSQTILNSVYVLLNKSRLEEWLALDFGDYNYTILRYYAEIIYHCHSSLLLYGYLYSSRKKWE